MTLPILQSAIDDIRDYYENYPNDDFFESCNCEGYTVADIDKILGAEVGRYYAKWIYENEK